MNKKGVYSEMDKFFKLSEHGTTVRTEVLAGLTTFFAMSYILFVNPQMLSQTGMPAQGVFLATIIGSVVGTLMMAFLCQFTLCTSTRNGLKRFLYLYRCIWYGLLMAGSFGNGLHLWCDFINYHIDKCSEDDHRIDSDRSSLCYFSGDRDFLGLCWD